MAAKNPIRQLQRVIRRARAREPELRVRRSYASCTVFSSRPVVCPLCKADVPANTEHTCESVRDVSE